MFIHTSESSKANIKVYRETSTPKLIWTRLSDTTLVAYTFAEAQEIAAGLTRELQAELAKQVQS